MPMRENSQEITMLIAADMLREGLGMKVQDPAGLQAFRESRNYKPNAFKTSSSSQTDNNPQPNS